MKSRVAALMIMLLGAAAMANHSNHYWTLAAQAEDKTGKMICTWQCRFYPEHYMTTISRHYCHRPY